MSYEQIKDLPPPEFKRLCGVHIATFKKMVEVLKPELVCPYSLFLNQIVTSQLGLTEIDRIKLVGIFTI